MSLYDGNTEAAKFYPMLKWKIIPTSKWNTPMELFHLTIDDAKWDLNLFTFRKQQSFLSLRSELSSLKWSYDC